MDTLCESEFADEYQDWLSGHPGARCAAWFDVPLAQLDCSAAPQVAPGASLREVIALMNEHAAAAVLVVQGERLVGVFTERDVLRSVARDRPALDDSRVGTLMAPRPDALQESTTLAQALRTLLRSRQSHLPVVDDAGRPLSLISMHAIVEFVSDTFPKEILNAPPERQSCAPPLDGA